MNPKSRDSTPPAGTLRTVPFGSVIEPATTAAAGVGGMIADSGETIDGATVPAAVDVSTIGARCDRERAPQKSAITASAATVGHSQREPPRFCGARSRWVTYSGVVRAPSIGTSRSRAGSTPSALASPAGAARMMLPRSSDEHARERALVESERSHVAAEESQHERRRKAHDRRNRRQAQATRARYDVVHHRRPITEEIGEKAAADAADARARVRLFGVRGRVDFTNGFVRARDQVEDLTHHARIAGLVRQTGKNGRRASLQAAKNVLRVFAQSLGDFRGVSLIDELSEVVE